MINTTTTTSTVSDKYWKNREDGYKDGFEWGLKQINDRLLSWLLVGIFTGMIIGFTLNNSIWLFLSIIGLIYLVDKIKEIKP